jgi:hypothetical protein
MRFGMLSIAAVLGVSCPAMGAGVENTVALLERRPAALAGSPVLVLLRQQPGMPQVSAANAPVSSSAWAGAAPIPTDARCHAELIPTKVECRIELCSPAR